MDMGKHAISDLHLLCRCNYSRTGAILLQFLLQFLLPLLHILQSSRDFALCIDHRNDNRSNKENARES